MNNEIKELIDKVYDEGVRGASQPREVIIRLLELDPSSKEVAYLKERAAELAHIATATAPLFRVPSAWTCAAAT